MLYLYYNQIHDILLLSQDEIGASIIEALVTQHLFPASKLIKDGGLLVNPSKGKDITPLLDTEETRQAAYSLLIELTEGSTQEITCFYFISLKILNNSLDYYYFLFQFLQSFS